MTNRQWLMEKLQNMSDEELVDSWDICYLVSVKDCIITKSASCCTECQLAWLKEEHKEE